MAIMLYIQTHCPYDSANTSLQSGLQFFTIQFKYHIRGYNSRAPAGICTAKGILCDLNPILFMSNLANLLAQHASCPFCVSAETKPSVSPLAWLCEREENKKATQSQPISNGGSSCRRGGTGEDRLEKRRGEWGLVSGGSLKRGLGLCCCVWSKILFFPIYRVRAA